ncbi:hypothetical protein NBRC116188_19550 [Oceaniserpentilla sp. 4NH20-0058]|uniref:DUF1499 domain-containing protein n=1 Tax=Oceaniserpentilla sp. 4NH20-0058 TaxID=3127660 RepID=UPI0031034C47
MLNKIPAHILARLAAGLIILYPLAILGARFDIMHFRNSFLIFILAALLGFIVLVLSVLKLPKQAQGEAKPLVLAVVLTLTPLMLLGTNIVKARSVPFLYDVTTDTEYPPALVKAKALRAEGEHSVEYDVKKFAQLQKEGYPDIKPVRLSISAMEAFYKVRKAVQGMGWEVVAVNGQALPFTIEAVASSALFGFKDDIAIRVSQTIEGSQVDMRSMSREGRTDLGANAQRIQDFFSALNATK